MNAFDKMRREFDGAFDHHVDDEMRREVIGEMNALSARLFYLEKDHAALVASHKAVIAERDELVRSYSVAMRALDTLGAEHKTELFVRDEKIAALERQNALIRAALAESEGTILAPDERVTAERERCAAVAEGVASERDSRADMAVMDRAEVRHRDVAVTAREIAAAIRKGFV